MVIQPVWRHGFEIDAFAKQAFLAPGLANAAVSTISALMYCSHGWSSGPSGITDRSASCLS